MKTTIREFANYLLTQTPLDAEIDSETDLKYLYQKWSMKEKAELYNKLKVELTAAGLLGNAPRVITQPTLNPYMNSHGNFVRTFSRNESSSIAYIEYIPSENKISVEYTSNMVQYQYVLKDHDAKTYIMNNFFNRSSNEVVSYGKALHYMRSKDMIIRSN